MTGVEDLITTSGEGSKDMPRVPPPEVESDISPTNTESNAAKDAPKAPAPENEKEASNPAAVGDLKEVPLDDYVSPTEEELKTLRRVPDKFNWNVLTIAFVELCERFSFYGTITVFTNFIQHPLPDGSVTGAVPGGMADEEGQPGAMGYGQRASTGLTTFNAFWQYTMPLLGAWVADTYFGRYKTVTYALIVDIIGHLVLVVSALPPVLKNPAGSMSAFILGIIMMGVGTGGFKPNIAPLIVEQLPTERMRVVTIKGERVIIDPAVTATRIFGYFYLFINLGALAGQLGMVYAEYNVGFWLSFSLPTIMLALCPMVMLWGRKRYRRVPPAGSVLGNAFRLLFLGAKGRWSLSPCKLYRNFNDGTFWEGVKPSKIHPTERPSWMTFDDAWVDEVHRGFSACKVFLFYPLWWICYNQMYNNLVSQAATMTRNGVPNDLLTNLNPLTLVICIPLANEVIYPMMRKKRINLSPIKKITIGYFFAAMAMVWTAVVQYYIYSRSECGWEAGGKGCEPADISVWAQSGSYIIIALAEICASVTSLEYAYSKAPTNMRSMVQAISLFMNAIASAIGFGLVSLSADPYLIWNYMTAALIAAVGGTAFYVCFRNLGKDEDKLNMLPQGQYQQTASAPEIGAA